MEWSCRPDTGQLTTTRSKAFHVNSADREIPRMLMSGLALSPGARLEHQCRRTLKANEKPRRYAREKFSCDFVANYWPTAIST
jgi:hypothetical protein